MALDPRVQPTVEALERGRVCTWKIPIERLAACLRAILARRGLPYVDQGVQRSYGVVLATFTLADMDLSLILFTAGGARTGLSIGEGPRTPQGMGKALLKALKEEIEGGDDRDPQGAIVEDEVYRHRHLGSGGKGIIVLPVSREVFRTWQQHGGAEEGYEDYLASFPCTCGRGREEYVRRQGGRVA